MIDMLTTAQAAEIIGFSEGTLANWRSENKGPKYYALGGKVFYAKGDLMAWIEANKKETSNG